MTVSGLISLTFWITLLKASSGICMMIVIVAWGWHTVQTGY